MEQEGLEVTKDIILQYTIAPVKAHMKLSWLWNNVESKFKNILTKALEVNIHYISDFPIMSKSSPQSSKLGTLTLQLNSMRNKITYQYEESLSHYQFFLI